MPFLNLDDNFADHPKVDALTDGAFRLHVAGVTVGAIEKALERSAKESAA